MASNNGDGEQVPWFLKSSVPVFFPSHETLNKSREEFDAFLRKDLAHRHVAADVQVIQPMEGVTETTQSDSFTEVNPSTAADIREGMKAMDVDDAKTEQSEPKAQAPAGHPFMEGLVGHAQAEREIPNLENKMFTENGDITYQSSTDPLVDLFYELEDTISGPRLRQVLEGAWHSDPLATLKIIFNARSIHLGKSSRGVFYRCAGWLAQYHPLTLLANLRWLSRPVIRKKEKKDEGDEDIELVEEEKDENDPSRFDIKYGVSHGYWKDMLNMLALAANNKLHVLANPRDVLNVENEPRFTERNSRGGRLRSRGGRGRGRGRGGSAATTHPIQKPEPKKKSMVTPSRFDLLSDMPEDPSSSSSESEHDEFGRQLREGETVPKPQTPKEKKRAQREARHRNAIEEFKENPVYRALHLAIARLFAEQLEADLAALRGSDPKAKRTISLCGKWAPSHDHFHDRHTFIISSIAEIMYPRESFDNVLSPTDNRETYLRHARERYRKDMTALRNHLEIVEHDITAQTFENIKYDRVPSVAMKNYTKIFCRKDFNHFEKYIDRVAAGKANISGATLFPSTLVKQAQDYRAVLGFEKMDTTQKSQMSAAALVERKMQALQAQVVDGQWKTLVQRIKDSGTLSSSIAVCDTSGSMMSTRFPDNTRPIHSSIGLSLLIASATAEPFGGAFITFSSRPTVQKIDLSKSFVEQVHDLERADWGCNTDFTAVFEGLILPMALRNNLKQEDMVKRVFVFSDMQFDQAKCRQVGTNGWESSYERIKGSFEQAGYEMPELIFWDLDGARNGMASKPVTTTDHGTSLVSGYSQGMLKVFLDSGGFEEPEDQEEEEVMVSKDEDGDVVAEPVKKKTKMDPLKTVKKAIGHNAYGMLEVLD